LSYASQPEGSPRPRIAEYSDLHSRCKRERRGNLRTLVCSRQTPECEAGFAELSPPEPWKSVWEISNLKHQLPKKSQLPNIKQDT